MEENYVELFEVQIKPVIQEVMKGFMDRAGSGRGEGLLWLVERSLLMGLHWRMVELDNKKEGVE